MGNHARKKTKRGELYRIAMGPWALTASSGLAPWSILWIVLRQHGEKSNRSMGSTVLCPPRLPPHWGREGVTLAISKTAKKNSRGYLTELKFSGMYEPDLADAGSSLR
jgi:hypothetical protein